MVAGMTDDSSLTASLAAVAVQLPPGRTVPPEDGGAPTYWISDKPTTAEVWSSFQKRHPHTGLWPLLLSGLHDDIQRPWYDGEVFPDDPSSPDDWDANTVLAEWWADNTPENGQEPFSTWPGLAAPAHTGTDDPGESAGMIADLHSDTEPHLGLVFASRSADTLAAIGWGGPMNHEGDMGKLSAVLRSWEDRFGVCVVGIGFDTLLLSVATPPTTVEQALPIAAEHFAFCPDNIWQGQFPTLQEYAERLVDVPVWGFWWD